MKLIYLEETLSTQIDIKEYIKHNSIDDLACIYTNNQTNGIGSRDNTWDGKKGNLFFSFALKKEKLPKDLPFTSISIYFSFLLKELLELKGSHIWIKWPNDFYIKSLKIGGTITQMDNEFVYCGIGLNLLQVEEKFGYLDIQIDQKRVLNEYLLIIKDQISWKQVFRKFRVEFHKSKEYKATIDNEKISMQNAILLDDGSIEINGKKVYSLR